MCLQHETGCVNVLETRCMCCVVIQAVQGYGEVPDYTSSNFCFDACARVEWCSMGPVVS